VAADTSLAKEIPPSQETEHTASSAFRNENELHYPLSDVVHGLALVPLRENGLVWQVIHTLSGWQRRRKKRFCRITWLA